MTKTQNRLEALREFHYRIDPNKRLSEIAFMFRLIDELVRVITSNCGTTAHKGRCEESLWKVLDERLERRKK